MTTTTSNFVFSQRVPIDVLLVDTSDNLEKAEQYKCPICVSVLIDPRQCINGHTFCNSCITLCLATNPTHGCPICREPLGSEEKSYLGRNLFAERGVNELLVKCPFRFQQEGDKWTEVKSQQTTPKVDTPKVQQQGFDEEGTKNSLPTPQGEAKESDQTKEAGEELQCVLGTPKPLCCSCDFEGKLGDLIGHLRNQCEVRKQLYPDAYAEKLEQQDVLQINIDIPQKENEDAATNPSPTLNSTLKKVLIFLIFVASALIIASFCLLTVAKLPLAFAIMLPAGASLLMVVVALYIHGKGGHPNIVG